MEIRRIMVLGQHRQKVHETPSQSVSWAWWYMSVISVIQEALGKKIMV
jgi:hypothetical protein